MNKEEDPRYLSIPLYRNRKLSYHNTKSPTHTGAVKMDYHGAGEWLNLMSGWERISKSKREYISLKVDLVALDKAFNLRRRLREIDEAEAADDLAEQVKEIFPDADHS